MRDIVVTLGSRREAVRGWCVIFQKQQDEKANLTLARDILRKKKAELAEKKLQRMIDSGLTR